ncbi:proteasome inhibitor PI31 subunit-like isoform X2 [Dermacentor andersoni]|uniref:proteasome inhibitor PI31 subunit-like isoform X2 n=1 Tax=Dermacentor andersoni TaxID=34620 RepID=UPI002154FB68|nr:proteasome inhibitor PI31 subunit-like isoform X2 [Dermacentor andersoni]
MSSAGEVSGLSAFENYFALELLFKSCNESLQSKEDALIVLAHYLLVRNGKRCAGIGETWDGNAQHSTTELLPPGWNENQGSYTIRYISAQNNERYLLKAVRADNSLLICVLNIKEDKTASTSLNVGKYVSEEYKDCSRAFKDLNAVVEKVNREVINVLEHSESEISGVRGASSATSHERVLRMLTGQPSMECPRAQEPAQLGQRDLDPFFGGRSGGGMIMDPRELTRPLHPNPGATIPGLPRATFPPGARFDPFGPSSTNDPAGFRFAGPNPDHAMRPPDYDDMFS